MIIFKGRILKISQLNELPDGKYFIRLKNHYPRLVVGPPIHKSKLEEAIRERKWEDETVVAQELNLKFLKQYRGY